MDHEAAQASISYTQSCQLKKCFNLKTNIIQELQMYLHICRTVRYPKIRRNQGRMADGAEENWEKSKVAERWG
jgi:hypothetical protein